MKQRISRVAAAALLSASCAAAPSIPTVTHDVRPSLAVRATSTESTEILLPLAGALVPGVVWEHEGRVETVFELQVWRDSEPVRVSIASVKESAYREEIVRAGGRLDRRLSYGEVNERTVTDGQEETKRLPVSGQRYVVAWENGAFVVRRASGALAGEEERALVLEDAPVRKSRAPGVHGTTAPAAKPFTIGESIDDYARALLTGSNTEVLATDVRGKLAAVVLVDGEPCGIVQLSGKIRADWSQSVAIRWDVAGEITVRARDGAQLRSELYGPAASESAVDAQGNALRVEGTGTLRVSRRTVTGARL